MTEFLQDLLGIFKSRVRNVLYSTFIFSWIIVNWKFLFILLFSDDKPIEILNCLDSFYSDWEKWGYFLGLPVLLTILHIFVFSKLSERVYSYWLKHVQRLADTKKEIEGKMLLTVEEGTKVTKENERLKLEIENLRKVHINKKDNVEKNHATPNELPLLSEVLKEMTAFDS